MSNEVGCDWPGCKRERHLTYLDRGICTKHWNEACIMWEAGKDRQVRMRLGLEFRTLPVGAVGEVIRSSVGSSRADESAGRQQDVPATTASTLFAIGE